MENIEKIVYDLIKYGVYITGVSIKNDKLCYEIKGFAKSGEGLLYQEGDKIYLQTRYNQIDEVCSLQEVVNVAYGWDSCYCTKKHDIYGVYCVGEGWMKLYKDFGYDTSDLKG